MNSKSVFFISDVHLGVNPQDSLLNREKLLLEFLKSIESKASHLIILGDLFEFWYEYKYYISKNYFALFKALNHLAESGVQVFYLKGNHDFALEDFFENTLGVKTSKNLLFEVQGKKIYCTHGDGIASSDYGYRFFRRILDFKFNRKLFRLLHPDFGMALALSVGKNSRKYGKNRKINIEEYLTFAEKKMKESGADFFIHGHHHLPGIWNTEAGTVASPGEWLYSKNYLELKNGLLVLNSEK